MQYAYALFNSNGVQGVINLAQAAQETTVSVLLSGLANRALHYGVSSGAMLTSMPAGSSPADACNTRFVQGVFNPTNANAITGYPTPTCLETDPMCSVWASLGECDLATSQARLLCPISCRVCASPFSAPCDKSLPNQCAVGDLSGKHGTLLNANVYSATYKDANLPLSAPNSIIGKSLVIQDVSGRNFACATISASLGPVTAPPGLVPGVGLSMVPVLPTLSPATCIDRVGEAQCRPSIARCSEASVIGTKMRDECRKTCGQCSGSALNVNCQVALAPPLSTTRTARACTHAPASSVDASPLLQDTTTNCALWLARGQCDSVGARDIMRQACSLSCGFCARAAKIENKTIMIVTSGPIGK
jgi:hypothetical protein